MKKSILLFAVLLVLGITAHAQEYALIDSEYILEHIPAYKEATQQLDAASKGWQKELEDRGSKAKELYQSYQADLKNLSTDQRSAREKEIVAYEKETAEIRQKYFGPEGELVKKRETLLNPIHDAIYEVVKEIATKEGYAMVIDRATATSVIFASPDIDISEDVLDGLGNSN